MHLAVTNTRTAVSAATEDEVAWLSGYLSYEDKSSAHRGSGPRSLLSNATMKFPSGLLPLVVVDARAAGLRVDVDDLRVVPCAPDPTADLDWLADYQEHQLEEIGLQGRGVIHASTGSGKGEVAPAVTLVWRCRWVILVHRVSLVNELADRVELRTGEPCGRIGEGAWVTRRVTVASFQTIVRARAAEDPRVKRLLERAEGVVVDECHTLGSPGYFRVLMAMPNAYWRVGLSGTPYARSDKRGIFVVAALGPTIARVKTEELVGKGAVAKGTVHLVSLPIRPRRVRDYTEGYEHVVVADARRTALAIALLQKAQKPVLAFVRATAHGHQLANHCAAASIDAEFTWGAKNTKRREAAVRRLEDADIDVLVCSVIFQEGVNIPVLASVGHFGAGQSEIATLQNTGRGSRRRDRTGATVKTEFETWDILDRHCGCRTVDATTGTATYRHRICEWFERHSRARANSYVAEGYETVKHNADEFIPL